MARVLGRVRLSRDTDESTSVERQRTSIQRWVEEHDHTIVGWAEDVDVSGSVSPFDSPKLGPWLKRLDDWDVLCTYRLDRVARRAIPLNRLFGLCLDNGKTLVSTSESIDLSTWIGRMVANVIAGVAEGELEAVQERTRQTHRYNKQQGKYTGGVPPYGYLPAKVGGDWRLVPDPAGSAIVDEVVNRVLDGERLNPIVTDLNRRKVPTSYDQWRINQGQEPRGSVWRYGNLGITLRSRALLGEVPYTAEDGAPDVRRNEDGSPVIRAEPLLEPAVFDRLQQALDEMNGKRSPYQKSEALLLRVIYCAVCDRPMYTRKNRHEKRYYVCPSSSLGVRCGNVSVRRDDADEFVAEQLLSEFGDTERLQRRYDPGEDAAQELANVESQLASYAASLGRFSPGPALDKVLSLVDQLEARKAELSSRPHRPAGYEYKATGETFRDHWERLDVRGRNLLLQDGEVRLTVRSGDWRLDMLYLEKLKAIAEGKNP